VSALAFALPPTLEAHEPPEARGLARDEVRLLVSGRASGRIGHATFHDLPDLIDAGDLLVVNVSATLPAAIAARREDRSPLWVHFSTPAPPDADADDAGPGEGRAERWVVELRSEDGTSPLGDGVAGERLTLAGGALLQLLECFAGSDRLWLARVHSKLALLEHLARDGRPIRYGHTPQAWPLEAYQTVFARLPGSAEMPSAGRPFTPELVTRLIAAGVHIAPIVLHAGVSSLERHEPPYPERYVVPPSTARLLATVRQGGGRVIAVGTTVVRALETFASLDGSRFPDRGWTDLVIDPDFSPRVVDGLISGFHEPQASHLWMLEAIGGPELLARSYDAALEHGYRWHEFGDSHLILP
jgi:S-adenosylmethionine:tRNA ribosyltransferase-isomerase